MIPASRGCHHYALLDVIGENIVIAHGAFEGLIWPNQMAKRHGSWMPGVIPIAIKEGCDRPVPPARVVQQRERDGHMQQLAVLAQVWPCFSGLMV